MASLTRCLRYGRVLDSRAASFVAPAARFSSTPIEEKGRGDERVHFRKEDEKLLRALLAKVKKQADAVDVHEAEGAKAQEVQSLKAILDKYSVSDEDLQALVAWKHSS